MPVGQAVLKLAIPTVFGCIVMILYNLVDTYFVGMLDDPIQTTAVTLVAPVILLFNAVNNLFGVGTGSMMSRALGKKDYETVKRTASFGFYAALLSGILFSVLAIVFQTSLLDLLGSEKSDSSATLEYMRWTVFLGAAPAILNVVMGNMVRSEGAAMHATLGTISGCILNMILDPFFILPQFLGMGAAGAGLATCLSNVVACLYFFVYIIVKGNKTMVTIHPKYAIPSKLIIKEVFGVGVPSAIQNILNVTGMTILNNIMASYGAEAVSAMGISHKLSMIPMYIAMGIGQGIMPLIGYNYAGGNKKRIRDSLWFTIKISAGAVFVIVTCFLVFASPIVSAFMKNAMVVKYGSVFLQETCLAIPFFALDFLAVGIFQACGLGRYAFRFAVARKVILEIPGIIILNKLFSWYGVAFAQVWAEFVLAIVAVFLIRKIVRDNEEDMSNDTLCNSK